MRLSLLLFLFCIFGAGVAGFNTTAGLGQDIQATGEKVEEVADDAKEEISNNDE